MASPKVARYRIQRRLGVELPGLGKAGALERRPYPPGQNGNKRRKFSDYALRLEEKQKIRNHYVLRETQLRRFIRQAKTGSGANWTAKLIGLLETRIDNLVFRLGWAPSIRSARQLVGHGFVMIDGKKADIASIVVKPGQKLTLSEKGVKNQIYLHAKQSPRLAEIPEFIRREGEGVSEVGIVQSLPGIEMVPFTFDAGLFTEYYAARNV
jgi:small subunit ribosomal protein S4